MTPAREDIIRRARECLGWPYHPQGRCRAGIDCLGLIAVCSGLNGTNLDRINYAYGKERAGELRAGLLEAGFAPVPIHEAEPGDVVTFHGNNPRIERHAAVLTETGLIHITQHMRGVMERGWTDGLLRLRHSAYRFPSVVAEGAVHG